MSDLLKNKNFVVYFVGRTFSNIGQLAIMFLGVLYIVDTLGDAKYQGFYTSFIVGIQVIIYPIAIAYAKAWKKVKVMCTMDYLSALMLGIGATFMLLNQHSSIYVNVMILAVVGALVAVFITFFNSASGGILPYIIEEKQYPAAAAMISFILTGSQVLGLIMAGVLYNWIGMALTLYVFAGLFLISAISEMFIKLNGEEFYNKPSSNIFKTYKTSLKEAKRCAFHSGAGSRALMTLVISSIMVMAYHNMIAPQLVKIYLGFSGEDGTNKLSIFKSLTAVGAMLGALMTPIFIKRKFAKNSAKIGLLIETPIMFMYAGVVTIFSQGWVTAEEAFMMSAFVMLARTFAGSFRFGSGKIGIAKSIPKKEVVIFDTQLRYFISILELPLYLVVGYMISYSGLEITMYALAIGALVLRLIGVYLTKDIEDVEWSSREKLAR